MLTPAEARPQLPYGAMTGDITEDCLHYPHTKPWHYEHVKPKGAFYASVSEATCCRSRLCPLPGCHDDCGCRALRSRRRSHGQGPTRPARPAAVRSEERRVGKECRS